MRSRKEPRLDIFEYFTLDPQVEFYERNSERSDKACAFTCHNLLKQLNH